MTVDAEVDFEEEAETALAGARPDDAMTGPALAVLRLGD
jgi:hypothetical protein